MALAVLETGHRCGVGGYCLPGAGGPACWTRAGQAGSTKAKTLQLLLRSPRAGKQRPALKEPSTPPGPPGGAATTSRSACGRGAGRAGRRRAGPTLRARGWPHHRDPEVFRKLGADGLVAGLAPTARDGCEPQTESREAEGGVGIDTQAREQLRILDISAGGRERRDSASRGEQEEGVDRADHEWSSPQLRDRAAADDRVTFPRPCRRTRPRNWHRRPSHRRSSAVDVVDAVGPRCVCHKGVDENIDALSVTRA